MRELIIDRIMSSRLYTKTWESGEDVPCVREMPNEALLEYYDFCMSH